MSSNPFKHLHEAISTWSEQTNWGSLDHEARIKDLLSSDPPLDRASEAYIERSLADPITTRFFTDHARSIAWLKWVEEKGLLGPLFGSNQLPDEVSRLLAFWFADNYVCAHSETALGVVQRAGGHIGELLWNAITLALHPKRCTEIPVIEKWLPVLLQEVPPKDHHHTDLETMVMTLELSKPAVLLLMGFFLQPLPSLRPRFLFGDEGEGPPVEIDLEIDLQGDDYWLGEVWNKKIKPNLNDYAVELAPIVTSALARCHYILRVSGRANESWEPTSYQRVAIENQSLGGGVRNPTDLLIDAARDIVEHLLTTDVDRAQSLVSDWMNSDSPLLKRLAIHAYSERTDLSADDKLNFLLENDLLYAEPARHEVFRILAMNYRSAQDETRKRILEIASRGPEGEHAVRLREDAMDYVKYNLVVWLHQAAPDDSGTKDLLDAVATANPDFEPKENPDLAWVIRVGPHEVESPLSVDELQAIDPRQDIARLIQAVESADDYFERDALLSAISASVRNSFGWSVSLVEGLQGAEAWATPIWGALITGWATSKHTSDEWSIVLGYLLSHQDLGQVADQLADMLVNLARSSMPEFGAKQFEEAEQLYDAIWLALGTFPEQERPEPPRDWLSEAINRAGGRLAEFLIRRIDAKRKVAQEDSVTAEDIERLSRICDGTSYSHHLALVIISQDLLFLFSLDPDWTRDKLLPTFDWDTDATRAEAAWAGYLWGPRWHRGLLPALVPLIQETFERLTSLRDEARRQLAALVAGISVHATDDPMSRPDWLRKYLAAGEVLDRTALADSLSSALDPLDNLAVKDLWQRWLRDYVTERVNNVPAVADPEEMRALYELIMPLRAVMGELVPVLVGRPPVNMRYSRIYDLMSEASFSPEESPFAAQLLEHLLLGAETPFFDCFEVGALVRSLIAASAPRDVLINICNRMAELDCGEAADLRVAVEAA
jgi:hypothetical protein